MKNIEDFNNYMRHIEHALEYGVTCARCGSIMKEEGYAFNAVNYPRFTCVCGNEAVAYLPYSAEKIRGAVKAVVG